MFEKTRSVRNRNESCSRDEDSVCRSVSLVSMRSDVRTDTEVFGMLVHRSFNVGRDGRSALVENSKLWKMVEKSGHSHLNFSSYPQLCFQNELKARCETHPLFLTTTKQIFPFFPRI